MPPLYKVSYGHDKLTPDQHYLYATGHICGVVEGSEKNEIEESLETSEFLDKVKLIVENLPMYLNPSVSHSNPFNFCFQSFLEGKRGRIEMKTPYLFRVSETIPLMNSVQSYEKVLNITYITLIFLNI